MSYSDDFTGPYLLGLTEAMAKTDRYAAARKPQPPAQITDIRPRQILAVRLRKFRGNG
jgi:hypothetical protein